MNTPTIPNSRKKPVAAGQGARIAQPRTSPEAAGNEHAGSAQNKGRSTSRLSITRYAQVVRQTAWRLTNTVREATADGSLGSVEISRLHVWVTADLVPWAAESVELVDDAAKRQVVALIAEVKRLDAELSASIGTPAAEIADQLRATGSAILSILVSDD